MIAKERCTMSENTKKLLEIVSANKELAAKIVGMGKEEINALARNWA